MIPFGYWLFILQQVQDERIDKFRMALQQVQNERNDKFRMTRQQVQDERIEYPATERNCRGDYPTAQTRLCRNIPATCSRVSCFGSRMFRRRFSSLPWA